jgi:hypothetical protein
MVVGRCDNDITGASGIETKMNDLFCYKINYHKLSVN